MTDIYAIEAKTIDGEPISLDRYRGKSLLIVNVASECGYTPQYAGLEALYRKYQDRGFVVLGFPCDQFGHQEPGTESDIRQFCSTTYGVTFPMFAKVDVNGPNAHPLFRHLTSEKKGLFGRASIPWNFSKFLVGPDGRVLKRYAARDKPDDIEKDLAALLR